VNSTVLPDQGWNAPTKIRLICDLTFLSTSIPLHILKQKLLKLIINSVNPRSIQHLDQCLPAVVQQISVVKFES